MANTSWGADDAPEGPWGNRGEGSLPLLPVPTRRRGRRDRAAEDQTAAAPRRSTAKISMITAKTSRTWIHQPMVAPLTMPSATGRRG